MFVSSTVLPMGFPFLQNALMSQLFRVWIARQIHQNKAVVDAIEVNASATFDPKQTAPKCCETM